MVTPCTTDLSINHGPFEDGFEQNTMNRAPGTKEAGMSVKKHALEAPMGFDMALVEDFGKGIP